MRINRRLQASALLLLLLISGSLFPGLAQSQDHRNTLTFVDASGSNGAASQDLLEPGKNEFGVWGGGSWLAARVAGTARDTKLGIVGLRYARVLSSGKVAVLKYTVDVIPSAVLSYPKSEFILTASGFAIERSRPAVHAAGSAPIGVQVNFRPQRRLQPFASISGGCLYFAEKIPDRFGTQFNFTADLGGGIQILSPSHQALTIGYKLHHISNAERGDINPGFDSNLFYVGFSLFK